MSVSAVGVAEKKRAREVRLRVYSSSHTKQNKNGGDWVQVKVRLALFAVVHSITEQVLHGRYIA